MLRRYNQPLTVLTFYLVTCGLKKSGEQSRYSNRDCLIKDIIIPREGTRQENWCIYIDAGRKNRSDLVCESSKIN